MLKNIGLADDLYYLPAYISGSSNWDYLRLFPKVGKFLPKIKVYFAQPQKLSEILKENLHPKELTAKLENEYNDFQKNHLPSV